MIIENEHSHISEEEIACQTIIEQRQSAKPASRSKRILQTGAIMGAMLAAELGIAYVENNISKAEAVVNPQPDITRNDANKNVTETNVSNKAHSKIPNTLEQFSSTPGESNVAISANIVISQGKMGAWAFQTNALDGIGQFVTGPGTPPLGAGSVELASGSNGSNYSAIYTSAYDGQTTLDFANMAANYSTYVPEGASAASYPKLIVDLNINTTTTIITDELVFDPRNGQSQTPIVGVWQTWAAKDGVWNSSLPCGNTTLAQYANCLPRNVVSISVRTRADGTGGERLQVGPNASQDHLIGYVDKATLGFDGTNTATYDFEPPPSVGGVAERVDPNTLPAASNSSSGINSELFVILGESIIGAIGVAGTGWKIRSMNKEKSGRKTNIKINSQ